MKKVLVISSSIGGAKSITNKALSIFIENYKLVNPQDQIDFLDLNELERFEKILNTKSFPTFFNEESKFLIDQLKSANKIVISAGMVNFNIPSSLKNYFDNVLKAGETFQYKYDGDGLSDGLLNPDTKAQLILAQGADLGWYPFALFEDYIEGVLNFIGVEKVNTIIYDGTKTNKKVSLKIEEIINKEKLIELSNNF